MSPIKSCSVILLGLLVLGTVMAGELIVPEIVQRQVEASIQQFRVDKNNQALVKNLFEHTQTKAWQDQQSRFKQEILQLLKQDGILRPDQEALLSKRIVIFISQSIPTSTLRRYARDLAKVSGLMVIRGGIKGLKTLKPTLGWMQGILKKDTVCQGTQCQFYQVPILIDPVLFQNHNITQVPAAIMVNKEALQSYCERNASQARSKAPVVYGDAALLGLAEALFRLSRDESFKPIIQKLEGRG